MNIILVGIDREGRRYGLDMVLRRLVESWVSGFGSLDPCGETYGIKICKELSLEVERLSRYQGDNERQTRGLLYLLVGIWRWGNDTRRSGSDCMMITCFLVIYPFNVRRSKRDTRMEFE